jgi:hypothetical protein
VCIISIGKSFFVVFYPHLPLNHIVTSKAFVYKS